MKVGTRSKAFFSFCPLCLCVNKEICQVNREVSVLNSATWPLTIGKCVRLFVEVILLIAGTRASEPYMEICVAGGSWEKSDLKLLLTGE